MRLLIRYLYRRQVERYAGAPLEKVGSDYGGWVLPVDLIQPGWTCYAGGVGEDITFDREIIERFGCRVFAFDPTPRAAAHVEQHAEGFSNFRFLPVGLWSEDTVLRFYAPRDPAHVSHSIVNLQETNTYFEAPCRTVSSLMSELGHDEIDLLKIDIEGAEHEVVRSMFAQGVFPTLLCMEIDQPAPLLKITSTVRRIRKAGYTLINIDGWNFTFVHAKALSASAG
nr:FkbM family methyltransferase [cf. Phormidesmis sp. LEGE 11477]